MDARVLEIARAAGKEDRRYTLAGVRLRKKGPGVVEAVACDGRVLVEVKMNDDKTFEEGEPAEILIPAEACRRGLQILAADRSEDPGSGRDAIVEVRENKKAGTVILKVTDTHKRVTEVQTRAAKGNFPKTEDIWPKDEPAITVRFCTSDLIKALSVLLAAAGGADSDGDHVMMTIYSDKKPVRLSADTVEDGSPVRALVTTEMK
ncbi:MAG TPA: hypothetical protein VM219_08920 [Phycisphaerae bacterium]|nr:hypothetical protein [Phycisphaerae bacterium]HUX03011.1 hypothetical protein [Phycisphaerae bacterium]